MTAEDFIDQCEKKGLQLFPWTPGIIRAVVHQNITQDDILAAANIITESLMPSSLKKSVGGE